MRSRRPTRMLSRFARTIRRAVRTSVFARLALAAALVLAAPSTAGLVEDALALAGFACCDDETDRGGLGDCCPGGESHCAGCVHPTAVVPEALLALEAPFVLEVAFLVPHESAPTASHRTPPFRPPSA